MLIIGIAARARNGVIGCRGVLPWHLATDLARFRELTLGAAVLMGRRTWESLPAPLSRRLNIVVSGRGNVRLPEGVGLACTLEQALDIAAAAKVAMAVIIGGTRLYEQALRHGVLHKLYLTEVQAEVEGDTHFPEFNEGDWRETEQSTVCADEHNDHDCTFRTLEYIGRTDSGVASA